MNKYEGMTVNECLYVSGLIDEFYKAVEKKDIEAVISILKGWSYRIIKLSLF